ncbi:short-chain dehydrogenase/reductase SDR [Phellopilus nigrolimitatus]|nr:short-chain dehydrogenase/reductase SDR [Phellopilus nigrolimitatus]
MATLAGKTIVVVGGSSGIGYGVAKASLLSHAAHVIIGSSSQQKVIAALDRLRSELAAAETTSVGGIVTGEVINAKDSGSVKAFFERVGEIDHLVWSSGDPLRLGFPNIDLDKNKDAFDVRFWGAANAAQVAKIRPGGSITLTIGSVIAKPHPSWSLMAGVIGAVDSLTRGLAVDLAPVRVNVVSPGLVKTELWDPVATEVKEKMFGEAERTLLVRHVAEPDEIAEAYLFLMKCGYITGQRIEVDGGSKFT